MKKHLTQCHLLSIIYLVIVLQKLAKPVVEEAPAGVFSYLEGLEDIMTNTRSTSKVFMSYDEQVAKLRSKNLCVDDEVFLRKLLKEISYFALISGYKKPF